VTPIAHSGVLVPLRTMPSLSISSSLRPYGHPPSDASRVIAAGLGLPARLRATAPTPRRGFVPRACCGRRVVEVLGAECEVGLIRADGDERGVDECSGEV
jgi:hypothetical protein